jgi:CheY-like chemotaxis protein
MILTENHLNDEGISPQKQEERSDVPDLFLAAFEHPPSPCSDGGVNPIDMYGDPGNMVAEMEEMEGMEETSVCSQDWCKSEQESHSLGGAGSGAGGLEASSCLSRARALILDPEPWGRKSLKLMLERCGFEVVCACGNKEALWHLQQSLQHPEGFSVIFINLSVARMDNYAVVRSLRLMEQSCLDNSSCSMTPALFVAVTDLDRWVCVIHHLLHCFFTRPSKCLPGALYTTQFMVFSVTCLIMSPTLF